MPPHTAPRGAQPASSGALPLAGDPSHGQTTGTGGLAMPDGGTRYQSARASGHRSLFDYTDGPENDRRAYAAECFVARRYGLAEPPVRNRPDDGWDLVLPARSRGRQCRINVKWTRHERGGLYSPVARALKSDAYALVTGWPDLTLRGFQWRHVLARADVRNLGHVDGYYLPQSALHSLDLLAALHGLAVVE